MTACLYLPGRDNRRYCVLRRLKEAETVNRSLVINEEYELYGLVLGNIHVVAGGDLLLNGTCFGNLSIEAGGHVVLNGVVMGNVSNCDGALTVGVDAEIIGDQEGTIV